MTYAVFRYESNNEAVDKLKAISVVFLLQESKLKAYDISYYDLNNKKIQSNNKETLAGFIACNAAKIDAVSIVQFPTDLTSDEYLMSFGNDYLGCISSKVKKNDLCERIELLIKIDKSEILKDWLSIDLDRLEHRFKQDMYLSNDEFNELKVIEKKNKNPYAKWIDIRRKKLSSQLNKISELLQRDF